MKQSLIIIEGFGCAAQPFIFIGGGVSDSYDTKIRGRFYFKYSLNQKYSVFYTANKVSIP